MHSKLVRLAIVAAVALVIAIWVGNSRVPRNEVPSGNLTTPSESSIATSSPSMKFVSPMKSATKRFTGRS